MDKNQVSISTEEYKEYLCLKKGVKYVTPKKYKAAPVSIEEITRDVNKFLKEYKNNL